MKHTSPLNSKLLGIGALGFTILLSTPAPAMSANPYQPSYTDNDYISVTGKVKSTTPDTFVLDFDGGLITVEMDDWDWYNDTNLLNNGEKVTVYGRIDDGWYESKKIEANSVYAHDRATYYYATDTDEEGDHWYYSYYAFPVTVPDGTWTSTSGIVESINGRELTLDIGSRNIIVDTITMAYNPVDDKGYQQIDVGDRIYVSGTFDVDFFEKNEIDAHSITSLSKDKTKKSNQGS